MKESTKDAVEYTTAQLAAGVLEVFPGGSILSKAFLVPLELSERRRTEAIIGALVADVEDLKALGKFPSTLEELAESDAFMANLTEMMRASKSTHDEEKRKLLRNAVLNAELDPPAAGLDEFFIRLIARYSVLHVRVLQLIAPLPPFESAELSYPKDASGQASGVMRDIPALAQREFPNSSALVTPVFRELRNDGLVELTQPQTYALQNTGDATRPDTISDLGKQFIRFLADPRDL